jgi:hypothetical protein
MAESLQFRNLFVNPRHTRGPNCNTRNGIVNCKPAKAVNNPDKGRL